MFDKNFLSRDIFSQLSKFIKLFVFVSALFGGFFIFSNFAFAATYVSGAISTDTTWTLANSPYVVSSVTINSGVTLTIDPGVVVKFQSQVNSYSLLVNGALNANGTSADKIYFTSIKDDTVGGDTNGDGNATVPASQNWGYIQFSSGSQSNISNAVFRYGSGWGPDSNCSYRGNICNTGGLLNISNSQISNNVYGLYQQSGTSIITSSEINNSNYYGVYLAGGTSTVSQSSIHDNSQYGVYNSTANIINAENNWWGNASGPYHLTLNPSGTGNKVSNNVDFIPWLTTDPTQYNNPPALSNPNQYKSDATTQIPESGITTESTVVFKATLNDADNDQSKLQIELKEKDTPFNRQDVIESALVNSGQTAQITRYGLVPASYHWRARAVDDKGNASQWQEFGATGNVDFIVKLVPLYTQVRSPYPSDEETKIWANLDYAKGLNYSCGSKIYQCGCALTSGVMVLQYYDDGSITNLRGDITPLTLNDWLNTQPKGYSFGGSVNWLDIARYSNNLVKYDITKSGDYFNNYAILNEYLDNNQPAIAKEASGRGGISREHFIVIDNKLATTYGVKDPAWYNTQKLNEITDSANKIRGYENGFDGLRLFYPSNGLAASALSFNLASPAEFLITDPLGRRYGKDPINNTEYIEIPDASYFTESIDDPTGELPPSDHENKSLYIENPLDGQYDIKVIGTGLGSYTADLMVYDNQGQTHTQTFTGNTDTNITASYNLNHDSQQPSNISIQPTDTESPVISHTQVNSEYILNSVPIAFDFSAVDNGVGLFSLNAKLDGVLIENKTIINFNQLGSHVVEIIAEDYVGNKRTKTIVYNVIYNFSGFLSPIKTDGSGIYKLGRTLPIKFQLTNTNGNYISTATAQLFVAKISDGIIGTDEITFSTSNADIGNIFRYDAVNNQYIYNFSTDTLSVGSWQLKVVLDDGKYYTVVVSVK